LKLLKYILFGNFWSFLLTLSGIVDIAIGIFVLTNIISVDSHSFLVSIICFIIGIIYLTGGFIIAMVKMKKQKD